MPCVYVNLLEVGDLQLAMYLDNVSLIWCSHGDTVCVMVVSAGPRMLSRHDGAALISDLPSVCCGQRKLLLMGLGRVHSCVDHAGNISFHFSPKCSMQE